MVDAAAAAAAAATAVGVAQYDLKSALGSYMNEEAAAAAASCE